MTNHGLDEKQALTIVIQGFVCVAIFKQDEGKVTCASGVGSQVELAKIYMGR